MLKRSTYLIACAALLALPACGAASGSKLASRQPGAPSSPPSTIGTLAQNAGGENAAAITPSQPLAVDSDFMSCADAARFVGEDLLVAPDPPSAWGLPACAIEPDYRTTYYEPAQLPDKTKGFYTYVYYLPASVDIYQSSDRNLSAAGGVLIQEGFGLTEVPLPPQSAEVNGLGQRVGAHTEVNGNPAWVAGTTADNVVVLWWITDGLGHRVEVHLVGRYPPDELVGVARSLTPALPAKEYAVPVPPPRVPPATTVTAAETTTNHPIGGQTCSDGGCIGASDIPANTGPPPGQYGPPGTAASSSTTTPTSVPAAGTSTVPTVPRATQDR